MTSNRKERGTPPKTDLSRAVWLKSTYSGGNGNCVEVARNFPDLVAVRDSKDPHGPCLVLAPDDWQAFTGHLKTGRHDLI